MTHVQQLCYQARQPFTGSHLVLFPPEDLRLHLEPVQQALHKHLHTNKQGVTQERRLGHSKFHSATRVVQQTACVQCPSVSSCVIRVS